MQRVLFLFLIFAPLSIAHGQTTSPPPPLEPAYLIAMLDTINTTEQEPIRRRDALMKQFGVESEEAAAAQAEYKRNHAINEKKVRALLDTYGWPDPAVIGERGIITICNVIQHAEQETRVLYLPMMQDAVKAGKLPPRLLARAEDRIASERGELQLYGGQMKYYPESKSFNVWPVYDPVNIDKRRAAIGLGPIAEHLKNRFDFEWNLEEQIERTKAYEASKQ
ncbi:MAG: DUF6624 domain-containing protein [Bacteroidota bacterium]